MEKVFTQTIVMNCTKGQYYKYIRPYLFQMEYRENIIQTDKDNCLVSVNVLYNGGIDLLSKDTINDLSHEDKNIEYINTFNPDYFLALSAMTIRTLGGINEWWTCIVGADNFNKGNIYRVEYFYQNCFPTLFDDNGGEIVYKKTDEFLKYFRKSTLGELSNYFLKESPKKNRHNRPE